MGLIQGQMMMICKVLKSAMGLLNPNLHTVNPKIKAVPLLKRVARIRSMESRN